MFIYAMYDFTMTLQYCQEIKNTETNSCLHCTVLLEFKCRTISWLYVSGNQQEIAISGQE